MSAPDRRRLIERDCGKLSVRRQCALLGLARSSVYRRPAPANDNELAARYELVRKELGEAIRLNESLGAPSARAMASAEFLKSSVLTTSLVTPKKFSNVESETNAWKVARLGAPPNSDGPTMP